MSLEGSFQLIKYWLKYLQAEHHLISDTNRAGAKKITRGLPSEVWIKTKVETEFCETSGGAGRHVIWAELSCGTILFHCIQSSHLSPEPETMLLLTIMILLSIVHIKQMTEFMPHLADESSKVKGGNLWRHTTEVCLTDSIQNLNVYLCLSPGFRPETVFFTTFVSEVRRSQLKSLVDFLQTLKDFFWLEFP